MSEFATNSRGSYSLTRSFTNPLITHARLEIWRHVGW